MWDPLPSCVHSFQPKSSNRIFPLTPRRAVHPNARFGSIYDARSDQILDAGFPSFIPQTITATKYPTCSVNRCTADNSLGLLMETNIHHELRLSIALNIIPAYGIAEIYKYDHPIDRYTRLISYHVLSRTEYLSDHDFHHFILFPRHLTNITGTHAVIFINYGISAFVILQLPHDDHLASEIDRMLETACTYLEMGKGVQWSYDEEQLLANINNVKVFSNVPSLSSITSFTDFYRNVDRLRLGTNLHHPYNYNLCPISLLFHVPPPERIHYHPIDENNIRIVEEVIVKLLGKFSDLKQALTRQYPQCEKWLKNFRQETDKHIQSLRIIYERTLEPIANLVKRVRSGTSHQRELMYLYSMETLRKFEPEVAVLRQTISKRENKEKMLNDLKSKQIRYENAIDYHIQTTDDRKTILHTMTKICADPFILCGTDQLYSQHQHTWNNIYNQMHECREKFPRMQAVYLDFTSLPNAPSVFTVLYSDRGTDGTSPKSPVKRTSQEKVQDDCETINILLFGETGVGKSTFINSLVNHLRCKTFKDADRQHPIVLLPISFIVTSGADFKEHPIVYPGIDDGSEEVHDQPGQSVTQHCRSYLFTIRDDDQKERKVRLIDTPGINDTRGFDQDEKNMQDILLFINSLTVLHAICIVMKPNVSRLDVTFRRCLTQLLDVLGDNAKDHIVFCFTNTRSTFYSPGDTGPVLLKFLATAPVTDIKLTKENAFCFDSESFRYLVAKQRRVPFDGDEIEEYKKTWDRSSQEATRFLRSIMQKSTTYQTRNEHPSKTKAQLQITLLIRPVMEAIRNLLRNIILIELKRDRVWIELQAEFLEKCTNLCDGCSFKKKEYGGFDIALDNEHEGSKRCVTCSCGADHHTPIYYTVRYKERNASSRPLHSEWRTELMILCGTIAAFSYFLSRNSHCSRKDLVMEYLEKMIKMEEALYSHRSSSKLNYCLLLELNKVKRTYQDMLSDWMKRNEDVKTSMILEWIEKAKNNWIVDSQWKAIDAGCESMAKFEEFIVPERLTI